MSAFHTIPYIKTKAEFKRRVLKGENIFLLDPSLFATASTYVHHIDPGHSVLVTNHPKRSWFAKVKKSPNGNLEIQ